PSLPLDTGPLFPRGRQLLQLSERRLVVRFDRQDGAQLLRRLPVVTRLRQSEGQVQPGERILRIRLQRPTKRGDRLRPALALPEGDAQKIVDIGEVRVELAGQSEVLDRLVVLARVQETHGSAEVEGEALRPPQERLVHPLLDFTTLTERQRL